MRAHSIRRPLLMLGAVAALLISSVAPAAAGGDIQKGQVGHYDVPENEVTPTVNCRYDGSTPKLDKFLLKPPSVWWPDTNSSNDTQHGKVGWQIRIQETANTDTGPWTVTYKSSVIKKTAYEDQPFLDPADDAPFTTRGILWNRSGTKSYRVVYVLFWYNGDGSVKGSIKHVITYYKLTGDGNGSNVGSCPNKLFN